MACICAVPIVNQELNFSKCIMLSNLRKNRTVFEMLIENVYVGIIFLIFHFFFFRMLSSNNFPDPR